MDWAKIAWVGLLAAGLWQAGHQWLLRPVHPPDGLLAPVEPRQSNLDDAAPLVYGRWTLTPRAEYDITARILSRENYSFDTLSDLIPEDLALGWGAMSDNRVLRLVRITQGARFYSWQPLGQLPIPRQEVIEHSANTHVIPADPATGARLARLRVGQVVRLTGVLVDGIRNDRMTFHTSLTRSDTGAGACEVLLVRSVQVQ